MILEKVRIDIQKQLIVRGLVYMIDFTDIIGHEDIIRHFKSSIELGKISQGYIINGETGSGKKTLTRALVKTLQCEEGGTEPCNHCK